MKPNDTIGIDKVKVSALLIKVWASLTASILFKEHCFRIFISLQFLEPIFYFSS